MPVVCKVAGWDLMTSRKDKHAQNAPDVVVADEDASAEDQRSRQLALRYILEAWEEAVYDGLDPDCVATAAIFAALSDMIATYGEEPVAVMAERLPQRIRNGEFTVMRHLH
jgi:predicted YcjX-like family ATPase